MEASICWTATLLSLWGVVLNIKKQRACFALWAVTNFTWTVVDISHGIYSQAALQAVYFVLSVYGLFKWSQEPAPERSAS